ncbi:MAG: hypothetical protein XD95_0565 [Microgenomates bacterium 39_7]|nr:MAG: hypothetical protein XD95_0565 [Microgenomates bacterium 39_7]
MPEQALHQVVSAVEHEPSEEILRPNYNPENLPNSQELKLFEQIVIILLEFAQPTINLDNNSTLADVKKAVYDYLNVIGELNSWRKEYVSKNTRLNEKAQWSLSSECQEFYTHFFHALRNLVQLARLFVDLALSLEFEGSKFDESTTLVDVINSNTDISDRVESVINLGKRIEDLHLMWINRAKQNKHSIDWRQLDELMVNLQSFNLKLNNIDLPTTTINLPKGVVECLINELITNSEQVATERRLTESLAPELEFYCQNQDKYPKLILRYRDYSGGFENLEIPVGQTSRKGGTGIGWKVITQITTALSAHISKENWGMDQNNGQPIGAKIILAIPLHPVEQKKEEEEGELQPALAA